MAMTATTGNRLRERRLAAGMAQADLARAAGISASYLNLIEHGRRRVGGPVLARLAVALGLEARALAEGAEAVLAADLREAAAGATGMVPEADRIEDFAARFPGWAALLAAEHRRAERLERAVAALEDRLAHDPHLSAALHEVLSAADSVRATAAILAETEEIAADWRARFHANLHADSERLALGAEALVAYLDASGSAVDQGSATPQEEVEAWLQAKGWQAGGGGEDMLASGAARALARGVIAQAAADAALLPEATFSAALAESGPDPVALAARFAAPVPAVLRRLALWPGATAGLVVCDGSGTPVFRKPAEGFGFPRFGAACPLWPVYTALRPGSPVAALVEMPARIPRRFRVLAWCQLHHPAGLAGPQVAEAAMLIEPAGPGAMGPALPVGTTCRICPRTACAARREPSILTETA